MQIWTHALGLPKEAAEVLSAAGGPGEDPVVSSQSGRHDVTFCLATRVALPVVDHPKARGGKKMERNRFAHGKTVSS